MSIPRPPDEAAADNTDASAATPTPQPLSPHMQPPSQIPAAAVLEPVQQQAYFNLNLVPAKSAPSALDVAAISPTATIDSTLLDSTQNNRVQPTTSRERPSSIISRRTSTLKKRHSFLPWLKKDKEDKEDQFLPEGSATGIPTSASMDTSKKSKQRQYHQQARAYHDQRLSKAANTAPVSGNSSMGGTPIPGTPSFEGYSMAAPDAPLPVGSQIPSGTPSRPPSQPQSQVPSPAQSRNNSRTPSFSATPGLATPNSHSGNSSASASKRNSFVRRPSGSTGLVSPDDAAIMGPPRESLPTDPNQHVLEAVAKFGNVQSNSSGHIACGILRSLSFTGSKPRSKSGSMPGSMVGSPLMSPSTPGTPGAMTPMGSSPDHILAIQDVLAKVSIEG